MNYKQKNQLVWLAIVEFVLNNQVHIITKVLLFITNHERELRIRADIRRKEKVEKAIKFTVDKRQKKVEIQKK